MNITENITALVGSIDSRLERMGWCLRTCERQGPSWMTCAVQTGSGKTITYKDDGSLDGVLDGLVRLVELQNDSL